MDLQQLRQESKARRAATSGEGSAPGDPDAIFGPPIKVKQPTEGDKKIQGVMGDLCDQVPKQHSISTSSHQHKTYAKVGAQLVPPTPHSVMPPDGVSFDKMFASSEPSTSTSRTLVVPALLTKASRTGSASPADKAPSGSSTKALSTPNMKTASPKVAAVSEKLPSCSAEALLDSIHVGTVTNLSTTNGASNIVQISSHIAVKLPKDKEHIISATHAKDLKSTHHKERKSEHKDRKKSEERSHSIEKDKSRRDSGNSSKSKDRFESTYRSPEKHRESDKSTEKKGASKLKEHEKTVKTQDQAVGKIDKPKTAPEQQRVEKVKCTEHKSDTKFEEISRRGNAEIPKHVHKEKSRDKSAKDRDERKHSKHEGKAAVIANKGEESSSRDKTDKAIGAALETVHVKLHEPPKKTEEKTRVIDKKQQFYDHGKVKSEVITGAKLDVPEPVKDAAPKNGRTETEQKVVPKLELSDHVTPVKVEAKLEEDLAVPETPMVQDILQQISTVFLPEPLSALDTPVKTEKREKFDFIAATVRATKTECTSVNNSGKATCNDSYTGSGSKSEKSAPAPPVSSGAKSILEQDLLITDSSDDDAADALSKSKRSKKIKRLHVDDSVKHVQIATKVINEVGEKKPALLSSKHSKGLHLSDDDSDSEVATITHKSTHQPTAAGMSGLKDVDPWDLSAVLGKYAGSPANSGSALMGAEELPSKTAPLIIDKSALAEQLFGKEDEEEHKPEIAIEATTNGNLVDAPSVADLLKDDPAPGNPFEVAPFLSPIQDVKLPTVKLKIALTGGSSTDAKVKEKKHRHKKKSKDKDRQNEKGQVSENTAKEVPPLEKDDLPLDRRKEEAMLERKKRRNDSEASSSSSLAPLSPKKVKKAVVALALPPASASVEPAPPPKPMNPVSPKKRYRQTDPDTPSPAKVPKIETPDSVPADPTTAPTVPFELDCTLPEPDVYLAKAKQIKHQADALKSDKTQKILLYLESIVYFALTGCSIERHLNAHSTRPYSMIKETFDLLKSVTQKYMAESVQSSLKNSVAVLSLRMQALLCVKLYSMRHVEAHSNFRQIEGYKSREKTKSPTLVNVAQVTTAQVSTVGAASSAGGTQASGSTPSPTPSPASSTGSLSSVPTGHVAIPQQIESVYRQQLSHLHNLMWGHQYWSDAEHQLTDADKPFFDHMDRLCGPLSLSSKIEHMSTYVMTAAHWMKQTHAGGSSLAAGAR